MPHDPKKDAPADEPTPVGFVRAVKREGLKSTINLTATVVGPILISLVITWVGWSIKMYMKDMLTEQDRRNAAQFVPKEYFEASHKEMTDQLKGVAVDVGQVKNDVATIKGELSVKK